VRDNRPIHCWIAVDSGGLTDESGADWTRGGAGLRWLRDEEAAGSNPVTPTTFSHVSDVVSVHCRSASGPVGGIWEDPLSIMDLPPSRDDY
jgi:hypothetical protein